MTNRITGINSGIDVDTVVKESLLKEQNKIDKAYQQQMLYTYQQEQLKTIISDANDFFDKYLDILASGNLMSNSAYETATFTSTNARGESTTAVTAKGYAGADITDYKVSVRQLAKKATTTLKSDYFVDAVNNKITNGTDSVLAMTMKDSNGDNVPVSINIVFDDSGEVNMKSTVSALNTELRKQGLNVTAKYSEFAGGIVLESGSMGEDVTFGVGIKANSSVADITEENENTYYQNIDFSFYSGQNAKGAIRKGNQVYQIDSPSNNIYVDSIQFTFNSPCESTKITSTSEIAALGIEHYFEDESHLPNEVANGAKATLTKTYDGVTTKTVMQKNSTVTSQSYDDGITIKNINGNMTVSGDMSALTDTTTGVTVTTEGGKKVIIKDGKKTIIDGDTTTTTNTYGGVVVKTVATKDSDGNTTFNTSIVSGTLTHLNSTTASKIVIESKDSNKRTTVFHGMDEHGLPVNTITTTQANDDGTTTELSTNYSIEAITRESGKTIINNGDGTITTIADGSDVGIISSVDNPDVELSRVNVYRYVSQPNNEVKNVVQYDNGLQVYYEDGTEATGSAIFEKSEANVVSDVTLSGKTDVTSLKDTIVKFVDDYNKLIKSINEKLWEKRDKDYMPLTEEQKKEMSDTEIEAWEKKAKTGLLRNDSDLQRIQSSMKSAMSALMSGSGLTLESIGIEPVDNYTTKNGMLEIDENKLTEALENNSAEVKDLFIRQSTAASGQENNGGVLVRLQSILKSEFRDTTSSLSERVGFEGKSTETNNTLNKNIVKQKSLITELKKKYKNKETALYKKYSSLEVALEKLNAQYNSLSSLLGQ